MEIERIINGPVMWLFAGAVIAACVAQSVVIYRMAKKYIDRTALLSKEEVGVCLRTGGVVAIGPALSVFVVALSMISMLGAPLTLMRVGMIGAAPTELTAASIGAEAAGVKLGVDTLTPQAFTAALWVGAVMSSGYLIFVPLVTRGLGRKLEKVVVVPEGQKRPWKSWLLVSLLPFVLFTTLSVSEASNSLAHAVSTVAGAVGMVAFNLLAGVLHKKWLSEWSLCLAVVLGIAAGILTNML